MNYINAIRHAIFYYMKHYGLIKTIKAIFYYHYLPLKRITKPKDDEIILHINGYSLSVIPQDVGISEELILFGTHEPLNTSLITKEIQPGMVCLDLGSNIGYYACLESKLTGKNGKVIAIEPSPINFQYLKKNANLQENQNIVVYNFAVSDKNGELDFFVSNFSNWSRIVQDKDLDINDQGNVIKVNTTTLDSFVESNNITQIDFLRMDVEGHEYPIFNGMKKTLSRFKPKLQIEFHKKFVGNENTKKMLNQLKDEGYKIKYYIPREIDMPIISSKNDVKHLTISELVEKIDNEFVPDYFLLFLENIDKASD